MTNQHRATDKQWAHLRETSTASLSSCLLELRDRIQQLEAAQQVPVTSSAVDRMLALQDQIRDGALTLADAVKEINSEPEASADAQQLTLVERVADAIAAQATSAGIVNNRPAHAAIREVATWLRKNPGPSRAWFAAARDLMDEANR